MGKPRTKEPEFDKDGYPTARTLRVIAEWPLRDLRGLMEFICRAWNWAHMATREISNAEREIIGVESAGNFYRFATGGWSGNEELMGALERNRMAYSLTWCMSARGGLHIFQVRNGQ